jgi:hypothetical protein
VKGLEGTAYVVLRTHKFEYRRPSSSANLVRETIATEASMPTSDIILLTFVVSVFCLFGGTLAFGSFMEWREKFRRESRS